MPRQLHKKRKDASTQTSWRARRSMITQTISLSGVVGVADSYTEMSPQHRRISHFTELRDTLVTPSSSADYINVRLDRPTEFDITRISRGLAALKIQKCYRSYRDRKLLKGFQQTSDCSDLARSLKTLTTLKSLMFRWRDAQLARANLALFRASNFAARCSILSKEVQFLGAIDAIRGEVLSRRRSCLESNFLAKKLAQPAAAATIGGVKVETAAASMMAQLARGYKELYELLSRETWTGQKRVDLLRRARSSFASLGHTCLLGNELLSCVDQEIKLLSSMNLPPNSMRHLRNRSRSLLLRIARNTL